MAYHDSSLTEIEIENNDNLLSGTAEEGRPKAMQFCWKQKGFRLDGRKNALLG